MTRAPIANISTSDFGLPTSRFHYDNMRGKYREKSHLLFTDTDFLMCEIETQHLYKDLI